MALRLQRDTDDVGFSHTGNVSQTVVETVFLSKE